MYEALYYVAKMKHITVSKLRANLCVVAISAVATFAFMGTVLLLHGGFVRGEKDHIWLLTSLLAGMVLHEVLHGLGYRVWGKLGWDDMRFGISFKGLMLYCHAKRPMALKAYRRSLSLPVLVTGFLPSVLLVWFPRLWLILYCGLMVGAGAGDLMVLARLRGMDGNVLVQDHPSEVGCYVCGPGTGIAS